MRAFFPLNKSRGTEGGHEDVFLLQELSVEDKFIHVSNHSPQRAAKAKTFKMQRGAETTNGRALSPAHAWRARVSKVAQSLQCVRIREKLRFHRRAPRHHKTVNQNKRERAPNKQGTEGGREEGSPALLSQSYLVPLVCSSSLSDFPSYIMGGFSSRCGEHGKRKKQQ